MEVLTKKDQFRKDLSNLFVDQMDIISVKEKEIFDNTYLINKINDLLDKYNDKEDYLIDSSLPKYENIYCYEITITRSIIPVTYHIVSGNMEELIEELKSNRYKDYITSIKRLYKVVDIKDLGIE